MRRLYEKINGLLELVPFEDICPGFHRCGYALYDAGQVWLADRVIPWDERFLGNTAIDFEGDFIAVYRVKDPRGTDAELLAASLVHEMFHAHQMRRGDEEWPDDFKLLAYPDNLENYRLKYAENQMLAAAYGETGARRAELLAAFRAVRERRGKMIGEYLEQELLAERIEGRAEYVGCRALQAINPCKFSEKMEHFLSALRSVDRTFFDIRKQAYITGAVYGLVCADCGEEPLQKEIRRYRQGKLGQIETFLTQNPQEERGSWMICGYDPMNMIICGRQVLCTHFVMLRSGEDTRFLDGPVLLELKEDAGREVEKCWILGN